MADLREKLLGCGQRAAWERFQALPPGRRDHLAGQLEALDPELLGTLRGLLASPGEPGGTRAFTPPELFPLEPRGAQRAQADAARRAGEQLLAAGRVGFVLVAGGQASRLGFDAPKGAFPVGPVSDCPLFAFHARRLRAAASRHGCAVPWYVMTSPANDAATREFFERHDHFGLPPEDVFFFSQDMLPALGEDGELLFAREDSLFLAPNGHGGCLLGLARSGALADMRRRGIEQISYFQVDNPLVRPADPLFLGLHHTAGAGMSSKVVRKRDAGEKVGVLGHVDGALSCIEYSDLPAELREARDDSGELAFRAGNIAVHALEVGFVESLTTGGLELPWHLARKKMKVVDADGRTVERAGVKFESFVFDALSRSPSSVVLEVDRRIEFSPVKNASGEDSPASCRRDLCALFGAWVRAAGQELPPPDADGIHPVEVDPVFAESQDEFLAREDRRPDVRPTGHLYS
jgi:UDP-N-acetylglucosamine/UDP-N-acetylgalactosamine diphosphorylase